MPLFDDEAVTADLDGAGIARIDLLERTEDGYFDVEIVELGRADGIEARVLARRADRDTGDLLGERPPALERADAAAQLSVAFERDERAGRLRQRPRSWAPGASAFCPLIASITAARAISTSARCCASVNISLTWLTG